MMITDKICIIIIIIIINFFEVLFRPLSPAIIEFLLQISAEIFDMVMCPVYLGQYFSAVSHSQFNFHENICNILVAAFKYLKIQEVDEGE